MANTTSSPEFSVESENCKIIEKVIEIRTVIPDDLCNTCFNACLASAWSSSKDYYNKLYDVIYTYSPHLFTFMSGALIATAITNRHHFLKSGNIKKGISGVFINMNKAESDENNFDIKNSYEHLNNIPLKNFISISENNPSTISSPYSESEHENEINFDLKNIEEITKELDQTNEHL